MESHADTEREKEYELIRREIGRSLDAREEPVILRVIAATGDPAYADLLMFRLDPLRAVKTAILHGADVVTDSPAVYAAADKERLAAFGGQCLYFSADEDVENEAVRRGLAPAAVAMRKAAKMHRPFVAVIAQYPEALHELGRIERTGHLDAPAVIATPAGFVRAGEAKEEILGSGIPVIASAGSRGGPDVGAAVLNAVLAEL